MLNFFLVDDHYITLLGTKALLEQLGFSVIGTENNGLSALTKLEILRPTICLVDLDMPGLNGLELIQKVKERKIPTKMVVLSFHHERAIAAKAQELGASGYLTKNFAETELQACVESVLQNEFYLSHHIGENCINPLTADANLHSLSFAEKKVLELVRQQCPNKKIAELLFISERTVETHRRNIIRKLNLPHEKNALLYFSGNNSSSSSNT